MNLRSYTWSADGNSDTYTVRSVTNQSQLERIGMTIGGTWDSGSVALMVSVDKGVTFEPAESSPGTAAAWDDDTSLILEMPSGARFYLALSGSSSPDLDLNLSGNIS